MADRDRLVVLRRPAGYAAMLPDGEKPLLDMDGAPLREPGHGWTISFILRGFGPVMLLELRHQNGNEASWYLDERFTVVAHQFADLPGDEQRDLRTAAADAVAASSRSVLNGQPLSIVPAILDAARDTLDQLMPPLPSDPPPPPIRLDQAPWGRIYSEPADTGRDVAVPAARLGQLFGQSILALVPEVMRREGRLIMPSPVDGAPLDSDVCLVLSHFVVAYRFLDPRHGIPFFLVATTHICTTVAAYFPNSGSVYVQNGWTADFLLGHHPGAPIGHVLPAHVRQFLRPLIDYVALPARCPVLLYAHRHLGHHLWQDLGGLSEMLARTDAATLPGVIMLNARASEMWGRLDALFPVLVGQIDRSLDTERQLILRTYQAGYCLFLPTGRQISTTLADRIVEIATLSEATAGDRAILAHLRQQRVPVVLVGLRVENRTVVDFPGFVASLVAMIRDECADRVAIVIDGHNADDGVTFESHSQGVIHTDPVLVERRIADAAIAAVAGSSTVLIDTVGAPMARSIFWSRNADFFVTPWGAGLAKYRWIGDRPGLVLAGRLFQSTHGDLHIYDDHARRENSVAARIIDPAAVEDAPDDPCLIPIAEPARTNYRVDHAAVRAELRELLSAVGRQPPSGGEGGEPERWAD